MPKTLYASCLPFLLFLSRRLTSFGYLRTPLPISFGAPWWVAARILLAHICLTHVSGECVSFFPPFLPLSFSTRYLTLTFFEYHSPGIGKPRTFSCPCRLALACMPHSRLALCRTPLSCLRQIRPLYCPSPFTRSPLRLLFRPFDFRIRT